ncbi:MAG: Deoxyribonuclease-1 [archaeon GW2011_AR20]|nr:MAG: Deoxyribonuclease-1 [archaeon GW2011_AR20]MBS3160620.1 hypothetical protein [Candidatus Woesearchaeota archaeon]
MKKSIIILMIFLVLSLASLYYSANFRGDVVFTGETIREPGRYKIANWNLNIFGVSKANNSALIESYANILSKYDIIFIQEIRDASYTSFDKLCIHLANYTCITSSRAGKSISKEQYGIIYRNEINIAEVKDYNPDPRFERPPIKITFDLKDYFLTVYNIHTKPEDVSKELSYLEDLVEDTGNIMIIGDLNADCSYYNNYKETQFDKWHWIINDDEDTTVSRRDCAYDRIIFNDNAYEYYVDYGILKNINSTQSDHYLIWTSVK